MFRILHIAIRYAFGCSLLLSIFAAVSCAYANGFKVLHEFTGTADGDDPQDGLVADQAGNLYGTMYEGGSQSCDCGTVFKVAPDGTASVLHVFTGGSDGTGPEGGLISDNSGNLYGTTGWGGDEDNGTIFKLAADGTEAVLYSFKGGRDGSLPTGNLHLDNAGNLFGTTSYGGGRRSGCGTVFKLAPDGTETVLYSFCARKNNRDGEIPYGGVVADAAGNLYGTTFFGPGTGCKDRSGCGTVFKLAPDGTETVLHAFNGRHEGANPFAGLIIDREDNLYGTTLWGGKMGFGTVFRIAPDGTETVLHEFKGGDDGAYPYAGLIADGNGNLYGTTAIGDAGCNLSRCGTVFKVAPDGKETVLHSFALDPVPNSATLNAELPSYGFPYGNLTLYKGVLYGTATDINEGICERGACGTVFKIDR